MAKISDNFSLNYFKSSSPGMSMISVGRILFLLILSMAVMFKQLGSSYYFSCMITDAYDYTSWAWQFDETLKQGVIYPRWMPLDFSGYGSPSFLILSPLSFYLTSVFNFFSDSLILAMNLTKLFSLFTAAIGIYLLIREMYPEQIAFFTACLYILAPGSIYQFYVAGSYPSTISLIWFPLILLFMCKYFKNKQLVNVMYAGLCYAGLLLTHVLNGYMFTLLLIAFALYISIIRKNIVDMMIGPMIILIGLLTSAAYLFPLVYERHSLQYQQFLLWNYADLFILPNHTHKFSVGFFWKDYYYQTASYVIMLCFIILLLLQMARRQKYNASWNCTRRINSFFGGAAFVSISFMFAISSIVWENVPFFKYVQHPTRWLIITDFAVIVLAASFFFLFEDFSLSRQKRFLVLLLPFLICLPISIKYIWLVQGFPKHELMPIQGASAYTNFLPVGVRATEYSAKSIPDKKVQIIRGKGKTEALDWKSEERMIRLSADGPVTLKVRTFNFPGWTAYIDSLKTETRAEEGSGAIIVDVPTGEHTLMLRFEDTPVRYYGKVVSLIAIISAVVICLYYSFGPAVTRP